MASVDDKCCGHDHVGGDELWLRIDDVTDLIGSAVDAVLSLPAEASRDERRAAMRAAYDARHAERAAGGEASKDRRATRAMWESR